MNSRFMLEAIKEAGKAYLRGEVPVGAVIVRNGEIIAADGNRREEKQNALSHAETEVIDAACRRLGRWRLDDCELYVTLEPCSMCAGAIINSRIKTLVFGAYDRKAGCIDSVVNLCSYPLGSRPEIFGGIKEEECAELLKKFFAEKRSL